MGIYKKLPENLGEFDVIVAGGGTAGCIVAARLAAAEPTLSILVVEAGRDNHELPTVVHPSRYIENQLPDTHTALFYHANKADQLAGRELTVQSGGVLGGGSSINFMMYTRAQRDDFDSWKTSGWSADELLPFLKKIETYHEADPNGIHGTDGPVQVSHGTFRSARVEREFIRAGTTLGYPEIPDLQDLDANDGFATWLKTISPEGRRQDAATAYLQPLLRDKDGNVPNPLYTNLHVLVETLVVRVLFEEDADGAKVARGVEVVPNPEHQPDADPQGHPQQLRARRLVVVSSGALGTPLVLERSGVGNPTVLEAAGVPCVADVPGVGHDYQDHNLVTYPFHSSLNSDETLDELLSGRADFAEALERGDPRVGWNAIDACSKIRPSEADIAALGPEFGRVWDRDFRHAPNRPLMCVAVGAAYLGDSTKVPPGQYLLGATYTAYPYSRGHMHITGPSVSDKPNFDVGFFTDPYDIDLKKLVWAYKLQRELMRRTSIYRGEEASGHPLFAPDSAARCVSLPRDEPNPFYVQDDEEAGEKKIEYGPEDDDAIEAFLRENVATTWHSLGTAKMAPRDEGGVVDGSLSVHGVRGLKVADLSIAPENVGGNTNNTAMVIGEKAADIILRELGII